MKKILALILTVVITICSMTIVFAANDEKLTGDMNSDGKITVLDATLLQKHLIGLATLDEETLTRADTDGNGRVNVADALDIQKYAISMITQFPVDATKPTDTTEPITKPETVTPNEMELEILRLVNVERVKLGRKELKFGDFYYEAAQTRAKEIDTCFAHIRPDGSDCFTAVEEIGIPVDGYRYAGENCARYYTSAESVMNDFMNSDGHRFNIICPEFDYLAVAVYESENYPGYYTVEQLFLSDEIDWDNYE